MSDAAADREDYGPVSAPGPFERGTDGPRVIMVGLDGTVTSVRAAAYAAGLARRQRSRLVVVFVTTPSILTTVAAEVVAAAREETFSQLVAEMRRQVRQSAEELGVPVTFLRRRGDPYTELRRTADEVRADMVVVGASTHAGHRLVGSIATRLVRSGRWPIVVVP